jgi:dihydroflavonol-4-reductase
VSPHAPTPHTTHTHAPPCSYVGSVVAAYALAAGYRVRGTVRDASDERKVAALRRLRGPAADGPSGPARSRGLDLVSADLEAPGGWDAAMAGATYVLHVASPVPTDTPADGEARVIKPAVDGVVRVLRAAAAAGTVRRVVVTSSIAAINEGRVREWPGREFSEDDWSDVSDRRATSAYAVSKTLAERAAWAWAADEAAAAAAAGAPAPVEVTVLNPGLVLGPPATDAAASSTIVFTRLFTRSMPAVPALDFAAVDVRDVAVAHLRAMTSPRAAGRRYALVGDRNYALRDLAGDLAAEFDRQGWSIPTSRLPSWVVRLAGWFDGALAIVTPMLDVSPRISNARARAELGFGATGFKDLRAAAVDTAYALIARGVLPDKSPGGELSAPAAPRVAAARDYAVGDAPECPIKPGDLAGITWAP